MKTILAVVMLMACGSAVAQGTGIDWQKQAMLTRGMMNLPKASIARMRPAYVQTRDVVAPATRASVIMAGAAANQAMLQAGDQAVAAGNAAEPAADLLLPPAQALEAQADAAFNAGNWYVAFRMYRSAELAYLKAQEGYKQVSLQHAASQAYFTKALR